MLYRFLGKAACSLVGQGYAHGLSQFGQAIELPPDVAERHIADGAALFPADKLPFTDEELRTYAAPAMHEVESTPEKQSAHSAFIAKRDAAWKALADWRDKLNQPPPQHAPESTETAPPSA